MWKKAHEILSGYHPAAAALWLVWLSIARPQPLSQRNPLGCTTSIPIHGACPPINLLFFLCSSKLLYGGDISFLSLTHVPLPPTPAPIPAPAPHTPKFSHDRTSSPPPVQDAVLLHARDDAVGGPGRLRVEREALEHYARLLEALAGGEHDKLRLCSCPAAGPLHELCGAGVEHLLERRRQLGQQYR